MSRRFIPAAMAVIGALVLAACTTLPSAQRSIEAGPFAREAAETKAPFGDAVSADIRNYTRVAPYVATAGRLVGDGVAEAQALGFELIIDLRRPDENGVDEERERAAALGLAYINLPLARDETAWDQVARVEAALADASNYPVLLHCGSSNRAAAVWALYRARQGVAPLVAVEEGRAAGLTSREPQVRELLNLPPLASQ